MASLQATTINGNAIVTGTLSESGYIAYPLREYVINFSALSATNFYPVGIDNPPGADATWHNQFSVDMTSQGGGEAYNMHSMYGEVRGQGWTDQNAFFRIFHNFYDSAERSILGVYRGTQSFYAVVVYLRGGKNYYIRTTSRSVVGYSAAQTLGNSVFAIKNVSGADVSGTSSNISQLINLVTNPSGFYHSDNAYVGTNQVVHLGTTSAPSLSIGGNATTVTTNANLTGDVTSVGNTTTIPNDTVTNAKMKTMGANTIKGNNTGSPSSPLDLTPAQLATMLSGQTMNIVGSATTATDSTKLPLAGGTMTGALSGTTGSFSTSITANGIIINQERATNARMYGTTNGSMGLLGVNSDATFRWQIYGETGNYGFLESVWGNWDIRKAVNGELDLRVSASLVRVLNAGNYQNYALPLGGGTLTGQLNINHSTPTSVLRLYSGGSTIWSLGVGDASGSYFNITADFGSFTINKTNGYVGIGTTSQVARIQLGSGTPTSATDGIQFGGDTSARLYRSAASTITCPGTIAAAFSGALTGNVTGNVSGSSGSCTGNAAGSSTFVAGLGILNYDIDRTTKRVGLSHYTGYSTGTNRPTTYDYTLQVTDGSKGWEISMDWIATTGPAIYARSLRDCCQNWSSWVRILDSANYSFAANMNQNVRTTDSPTFVDLFVSDLQVRTASPTITLRDTDHRTGFIHVNSNIFYILTGGTDVGSGNWGIVANSRWPLEINLSNNNATFGGIVDAISFTGAGTGLTGTAASLTAGAVTNGVYTTGNQTIAGTKTFSSAIVATNAAKAWVHFNGTGNVGINANYNVSSITDNGTGDYTVNFTSAFVDTNYVVAGTATIDYTSAQSLNQLVLAVARQTGAQSTGSCRLATEYIHGAALYDAVAVRAVFYR